MYYWHICKSGYGEWRMKTWVAIVNVVLIIAFMWSVIVVAVVSAI